RARRRRRGVQRTRASVLRARGARAARDARARRAHDARRAAARVRRRRVAGERRRRPRARVNRPHGVDAASGRGYAAGTRRDTSMGVAVKLDPSVDRFVKAPVRKMLIGGKWVEAASGKTFATVNPADGSELAKVAEGDAEDVDRAAKAARKAFDDGKWARMAPGERERLLLKVADLIEKHTTELAQLETLDNGKSLFETTNVDIP